MLQDVRFAARLLWKDRTFTATALTTLALCIGGNVAMFSVVQSVLLRPLPVPDADRILLIYSAYPAATGAGEDARGAASVPHYLERVRELGDVFEEQALYDNVGFSIGGEGRAERVLGWRVTPSFLRLAGVSPQVGRAFADADGELGNERKVILSDALWQRLHAGDPAAVGRDLRIDGRPHEIIGVMPAGFVFEDESVQLWTPLAFTEEQLADTARHSNSWQMLGRLRPGVSLAQARARLEQLAAAELERFPEFRQVLVDAGYRPVAVPLQEALVRDIRGTLYLLWGGVLAVLLIGVVNVANLTLVRANTRLRELAMRHALGAGHGRLVRQLLTESGLLGLAGGALGLGAGAAVLEIVRAAGAGELPRGGEIAIDGVVVAATLGVALVFGLALGLVPVAGLVAASLQSVLRQETRGGTGGRGVQMFRNGLVVGQIGLACVLLSSALLLLASFQRILQIDTGFRTDNLLTAQVALPEARYPSGDDRRAFAERILQRIRAIPGVTAAGITSSIPFGDDRNNSVIRAVGYEERPGESLVSPSLITIDGGYLDTLGVPLVEGRFFDERDTADAMRAIIIDERLARRFWPDRSALGGRMYADIELRDDTVVFTVVGVVAEHTLYGLVDQPEQVGAYFFPHTQLPLARPTFAIRTAGRPRALVGAVRATVAGVDAELPLFFVQTMDELVGARLTSRRTPMLLALGFAGAALFLSALGIYGVLAYRVAQRRREFGVRLALGSSAAGLFRLVLSEGALLVGVGLALGIAGTLAARRALAAQLYGIEAGDPLVAAAVVAVLTAVALAACALPARRATRVDPVRALSAD